jgi:hypothetical protein
MRADRWIYGHAATCKSRSTVRKCRIRLGRALAAGLLSGGLVCCAYGQAGAKPAGGDSHDASGAAEGKAQAGGAAKPVGDAVAVANEHKRQVAMETTHLLAMALALKAEVDKTNKDTLSLSVVRQAGEIERLARTVREKVK